MMLIKVSHFSASFLIQTFESAFLSEREEEEEEEEEKEEGEGQEDEEGKIRSV
jgi:hypothetical protein